MPATDSAIPTPRPVRQAATLIVLRDGAQGLEALLLRRADKANDQNSGASVFPGGVLDAHDRRLHGCCAGMDDARASARLSLDEGGLDYYAAAVRECFEESGLLLAQDAHGRLVDLDGLGTDRLEEMRRAAAAGTEALLTMCEAQGWQLAMGRLVYFAHWLTPPGMPRRFDTRFFAAELPAGQRVNVDRVEIAEHAWLRPADAISPERGLKLMNVTRRILEQLARYDSVAYCLADASAQRDIQLTMPRLAGGPGGSRPVNMEEAAYAEVGFMDPDGRGHARHTLEAGLVLQLSPRVRRVTASDGAALPGPGAHSYFVGGDGAWALIDPQASTVAEIEALRRAAPGPVRWILSTGEAPAGEHLLRQAWPEAEFEACAPGEVLKLGDATLQALAVPGADSARRFLLLPDGMLLAGAAPLSPDDAWPQATWVAPARGFLCPAA